MEFPGGDGRDGTFGESLLRRRALLRRLGVIAAGATVGTSGSASAAAQPTRQSPPPGPPVLYEDPVTAPQFENGPGWTSESLRVSGTDAYIDGEYLYQGWAYDDYGASTVTGPVPPNPQPDYNYFGPMTGDVVYPTDEETYVNNAADLLEFRAQRRGDRIVYRITLTTMTEPDLAGVAIGIDADGSTTGETDWGYGLGDLGASVDHIVVSWGTGAELDGEPIDSTVDGRRNQIEIEVPLDPGEETWDHYLVVGLYDTEAGAFKQIQEEPTETHPGGAHGQSPPPVFDVGFRFTDQEPMAGANTTFVDVKEGRLEPDAAQREAEETTDPGTRGSGYGHWRDHAQAVALGERDISAFGTAIDFGKLARRVEERNVPETGYLNLLYSSRYDLGDGVKGNVLLGRVQPYTLYVPTGYDGSPAPLHLVMPGSTASYNMVGTLMPNMLTELGDDRGAFVLVPEARGPEKPYFDQAELDVFEAMNDAANRYAVDFTRLTSSGYSRGGYGTYKLTSHYPDLFGRAFSIVGTVNSDNRPDITPLADNLRNVPLLLWAGMADELVPYHTIRLYEQRLRDLGYRHRLDSFPDYDHFRFGIEDEWGPAREFLADATAARHPRRVVYRSIPSMYAEQFDLVHDSAYWLSALAVADGADDGLVDAVSHGIAVREPTPEGFDSVATEPTPNQRTGVRWNRALTETPSRNRLDLDLTDLASLTVWIEEAGLDPDRALNLVVDTNRATTVTLAGTFGTREESFDTGHTERTVRITGGGGR